MKIIKTYNLFAAIAVSALLLGGCAKEPLDDRAEPLPDGEEVAVSLLLMPQSLQSPSVSSAAATKALDTQGGSMIAEVVDEPITRSTDDGMVNNVWVFQFNGSADNATLVSKIYRENITTDGSFVLKGGDDQRIVVLGESFDKNLGDALTTTSTYAALKALVRPVGRAMDDGVPMSGNVVTNITSGAQVTIPLTRIFAKVTLRVKLGAGVTTTGWSAQVFDVAPAYWLAEAEGDFPAADKLTGAYYTPLTDLTLSTTEFTQFTYYLPLNRRGEVAGTSAFDRKTNAPEGATYIKLTRSSTDPNMLIRTNYFIHLGANQTTDFNLRGNTHYTIKATLLATTGSDSRSEYYELDVTDLQVVGMFGGKLEVRNGVWQFTKELWVQKGNASTSAQWSTEEVNNQVFDKVDGKGNTLKLAKLGLAKYPAAALCFNKNAGLTTFATVGDPAFQWYLPAHNQLIGIWIAHNSLAYKFASTNYWSSAEYISYRCWFVNFMNGLMSNSGSNAKKSTNVSTRCVKEL